MVVDLIIRLLRSKKLNFYEILISLSFFCLSWFFIELKWNKIKGATWNLIQVRR